LVLYLSPPRAYLHDVPTRRSSDLVASAAGAEKPSSGAAISKRSTRRLRPRSAKNATVPTTRAASALAEARKIFGSRESGVTSARSEEHTSELQSLRHLVCRLLLEK